MFFFFSSRRRHTRSYGDWSSDVCSSDLGAPPPPAGATAAARGRTTAGSRAPRTRTQIGRASCRERVENPVVAVSLKKKKRGQKERRSQYPKHEYPCNHVTLAASRVSRRS